MPETEMMSEEREFLDDPESSYESLDPLEENETGVAEHFDIPAFAETGDLRFDQFLMEKGGEPEDWMPDMAAEGVLKFDFETGEVTVAETGELWTPPDQTIADALGQWKEGDLSIVGVPEYVVRTEESVTRYEGFMYVKGDGAMGYQMYKNEQVLPKYEYGETSEEDGNESVPHLAELHDAMRDTPKVENIENELDSLEHANAVPVETPAEVVQARDQEITSEPVAEVAAQSVVPKEIHTEISSRSEASQEVSDAVRDILEGDKLPALVETDASMPTPTIEIAPTQDSPVIAEVSAKTPEAAPEHSLVADIQQAFREVVASVSEQLESIAVPNTPLESVRPIEVPQAREDEIETEIVDAPAVTAPTIEQSSLSMEMRSDKTEERFIPSPTERLIETPAIIEKTASSKSVAEPIRETIIPAIAEKKSISEKVPPTERLDQKPEIVSMNRGIARTVERVQETSVPELRVVALNENPLPLSDRAERITLSSEQEVVLRSLGIPFIGSRESELPAHQSPESPRAPRSSAITQDDTTPLQDSDRIVAELNGIVMRRAA